MSVLCYASFYSSMNCNVVLYMLSTCFSFGLHSALVSIFLIDFEVSERVTFEAK